MIYTCTVRRAHSLTHAHNWHKMKINYLLMIFLYIYKNTIESLLAWSQGQCSMCRSDAMVSYRYRISCIWSIVRCVRWALTYEFTLKSKNIKRLNRWQTVDNIHKDFNKTIVRRQKADERGKNQIARAHKRARLDLTYEIYWYDCESWVRLLYGLWMHIGQFVTFPNPSGWCILKSAF